MIDPNLITTIRVGELPPETFSLDSKIAHEVGVDLKYGTVADLIAFISPLISAIQYQVITLHVTQEYIDNNFDMAPGATKGLGINLMTGYAIVNGNNGTINKDGMVGIAYGEVYNVIGQYGGEKTHILTVPEIPPHSHSFSASAAGESGGGAPTTGDANEPAGSFGMTNTGGGLAHNNMQPYLVELQVMKL